MAVILAANENLLQCKVPSEEEAKQIVANAISKVVLSIEFDSHFDMGLDPEAEDFIMQM